MYGFQPRTGKKLWGHKVSKRGINASPLVDGSARLRLHGRSEHRQLATAAPCAASTSPAASRRKSGGSDGIEAGFASPTIADGVFYVLDNKGKVHALDAMTGKPLWKRPYSAGTIGKASLVYGDGKLYVAEANGRVSILKVEKGQEKPEVLSSEEISGNAQESGREYMIFGSVAIANGRIYLVSAEQMYCIGREGREGERRAAAGDGEGIGRTAIARRRRCW